jgi:hypothetical protein
MMRVVREGGGQCRQTCGGAARQMTWVQPARGQNDDDDVRRECRDNGQLHRPPPPAAIPCNQEAEDNNDDGVWGGRGGCRLVKDDSDDDDCAPTRFGNAFPLPIGCLQPGRVGEGPQWIPRG